MKVRNLLLAVVSLLITVALTINCGEKKEEAAPVAANPGADLFAQNCASCHGEKGMGDGPAGANLNPKPRNYKSPAKDWKNGPTVEGITKTLKEGIPGSGMVSYAHLGDESIKQLAEYVITLTK